MLSLRVGYVSYYRCQIEFEMDIVCTVQRQTQPQYFHTVAGATKQSSFEIVYVRYVLISWSYDHMNLQYLTVQLLKST